VKFLFAEAWPTKAFKAYRPTTACLGNLVQASAASRQGQSGVDVVISFIFYFRPLSGEHLETQEVSKQFAGSILHTGKINQALSRENYAW
jgi:hypothetical protein